MGVGWLVSDLFGLGDKVRKARGNAVDVLDAAHVFLYRDSSFAPLLDMRRRFKAVMNILDVMVRSGISHARSVEHTAQWDKIVAVGPLYPVTLGDLHAFQGLGIGDFHRLVSGIFHHRLSDFIHSVVVHRRDEAIRWWRNWLREDPLVHPYKWLRPDLIFAAPFLQCKPHLTPGGSGSHVHFFVADVFQICCSVDRGILDCVLNSLRLPAWFRHAYFEYHLHVRLRFKLAAGLGEPWTRDGGTLRGAL